jgi:hypothetical protein
MDGDGDIDLADARVLPPLCTPGACRPALVCPADINTTTAPGRPDQKVTFAPTVIALDLALAATSVPSSGSLFPIGMTLVRSSATDSAGTGSCSFNVTVLDNEPPKVTAPPDVTADATSHAGAVVGDPALGTTVATDNSAQVTVQRTGVPPANQFPLGVTTVTYTATDPSGNVASATQRVTVKYAVCALYDQTKAAKSGSSIPIKFQLCGAAGGNLSAATVVANATGVRLVGTATMGEVQDAGNANPDSNFRFDPMLGGTGGYIFNLQTTGLAAGSYKVFFALTGDPTVHDLSFVVR